MIFGPIVRTTGWKLDECLFFPMIRNQKDEDFRPQHTLTIMCTENDEDLRTFMQAE